MSGSANWTGPAKLLEPKLLQDPYTGEELVPKSGALANQAANKLYPDRGGFISFLDEAATEGNNRTYLQLYNKIARWYRISNKIYFALKFGGERKYRMEFLSELELEAGGRVLEVSVGSGDNFPYLRDDLELFGLDLSSGMLKSAVRYLNSRRIKAELFQGEGERLPFRDSSFDCVFHVGGINFFSDPAKAVAEMIRVAKPGTKLLIVDETDKLLKGTYEKVPVVKGYYGQQAELVPVRSLIPPDMLELQYKEICRGLLYCVTFRKP